MIYLIQSCLVIMGLLQISYELVRTFNDSVLTMMVRLILFIATLVAGFYTPYLETLPTLVLFLISIITVLICLKLTKDLFKLIKKRELIN